MLKLYYSLKTRTEKNPFPINVTQRRNLKLEDPIEQGFSCYEQDENGQRGQGAKEPTTAFKASNFRFLNRIFRSMSRSTENDPFVRDKAVLY